MIARKQLRVLQVVGGMNRGGTETWLMHVLRHLDRDRFRMDFLVHSPEPGAYDAEIRSLGAGVLVCPRPHRPWAYARHFRRLLCEHGPYDIVHSHIQHYGGIVLRLARKAGVPVRIAHSHLDSSSLQEGAGLLRRVYLGMMHRWIEQNTTVGLAASRKAASALFGPLWEKNARRRLLYCGIDLAAFREPVHAAEVRAELGIPAGAFVLGHAGRFMGQKNHCFLVEIAAQVAEREPNLRLLLLGDGPLRPAVEEQAARLGLADRVIFAGSRPDVPRLMRGAMDVFVMPSLYEGLPLVGMEAQAAGLPLILSDAVTPEVEVIPQLVKWLPLTRPSSAWADAVLAARDAGPAVSREQALALMEQSPFNIQCGVQELEQLYAGDA